jgi:hypothetical protein
MLRTFTTRGLALACLLLPLAAAADDALEDQAIAWLQEFVRIDTINPPGNESRAVAFLGAILTAEGIPWQSAESAEGRGNLWARLEGGDEPALVLLQHTDVVPADPKYWTTDPLSGELRDGYIWGRGTLDMKGTGISQLTSFIRLHRAGLPLNRWCWWRRPTRRRAACSALGGCWSTTRRCSRAPASCLTRATAAVSAKGRSPSAWKSPRKSRCGCA